MEKLLTIDEVAGYLKIKPEIVRRKIRSGQLRAYKIGKVWRLPEEKLKKYLENCLQ